jgi:hypothetical protein
MGCDIHLVVEKRVSGEWKHVDDVDVYEGRNYNLFGILANVRNGTWGDSFKPISEPRGVPDSGYEGSAKGDVGDHSFSWFTLAELRSYDWTQKIHRRGAVNAETWQQWKASGDSEPSSYSAGAGGDVVFVSNEEMATAVLAGATRKDGLALYTWAEWDETYQEAVGGQWFDFVERLSALGEPEDVRIVFGFDS